MADINHVISLGIGSPAAIKEFLTFGLQQATPTVVPDVVGETEAQATIDIEAVGLVVSAEIAYSGVVAAGLVISQDPTGGAEVSPGSTVTITVSLGDAPVVDQTPTGGWEGFEHHFFLRKKRREEEEELREHEETIQEQIDRDIARLLHEQERKGAERADLERLKALVKRSAIKTDLDSVDKAFAKAKENLSRANLLRLQKEMERMLDEEDDLLALILLALND